MFKRITDSFRFKKSKTPTETVMLGIDGLDDYIKNINTNLDGNAQSYQRQKELINDIKQQTTKLINQKNNLVYQKKTLDTDLANFQDKNAKNLLEAISKDEYNKIVAGYNERINKIVIEIQNIDAKLKLQKPSEITQGLTRLLELTDSGINNDSGINTYSGINKYKNFFPRTNLNYTRVAPTKDQNNNNDLNGVFKNVDDKTVTSNVSNEVAENNTTNDLDTNNDLNEVAENNTTNDLDNNNDLNGVFKNVDDKTDTNTVSSGGYRYQMSSASKKNKYKKSSKKQSITRGGKRKHTRKHHKKGGNKRKHGRKSHKARK